MLEARLEDLGPEDKKAPISDKQAKNLADKLEDLFEFCLKKYQEVGKLVEEEERMFE